MTVWVSTQIFLRNCLDSDGACSYTETMGRKGRGKAFLARATNVMKEIRLMAKKAKKAAKKAPKKAMMK